MSFLNLLFVSLFFFPTNSNASCNQEQELRQRHFTDVLSRRMPGELIEAKSYKQN